jgi:hypothetical protein
MQGVHPGAFMGVFVPQHAEKAQAKARKPKDPNAPKRPRGRPRKDATQTSAKQDIESSTAESDEDELQIEEMPEPTPDLLRGPPPANPEVKVIYDVALAVWSPRNKLASAEKVRNGIALFGDVVKKQRDAWKVKNEALKQAENANTTAVPSLKEEVAQFRKTVETMSVQAVRFGHPSHLAKYVFSSSPKPYLLRARSANENARLQLGGHVRLPLCRDKRYSSVLLIVSRSHNKGLDKCGEWLSGCPKLHKCQHIAGSIPPAGLRPHYALQRLDRSPYVAERYPGSNCILIGVLRIPFNLNFKSPKVG